MKKLFLALIMMGPAAIGWGATTYIPVINANFLTGQWFNDGKSSALGGNAGIMVVPAVRFSSAFSLIPTIGSYYRGTRSSEELAGGNTFFQDTWQNGINVEGVNGLSSNWKFKERVGAQMKWYRETTNETWNNGLYDWRSYTAGVEVENQISQDMKWSVGYDFSYLQFPNYQSLESSQASDNSREFAATNPLDNMINLANLQFNSPLFWSLSTQVQAYYSPRYFTDQTVVQPTGLLSSTNRQDTATGGTLQLNRIFSAPSNSKFIASLNYAYLNMTSNQNHYDTGQTTFVADYYAYAQNQVGGSLTYAFGKLAAGPMTLNTGYSYSYRLYANRPIQSVTGAYLTEKLHEIETILTIGFGYPISRSLSLTASTSFNQSSSNNHFEEIYRYNFNSANYLFGFSYDY